MTYGIETYNGTIKNLSQTMPGGRVFVGLINKTPTDATGTVTTYTYDYVSSHTYLKVYTVAAGSHSIALSTVNSKATITLTQLARRGSFGNSTILAVFSTVTTEPDYGVAMTNDSGERLVSSIYPVPQFAGKITLSNTPSGISATGISGYTSYSHSTTTTLGSNTPRLVLWTVPENTNDVWMNGEAYLPALSSNFVGVNIIAPTGTAYNLPEGFVFSLSGLTASANTYGLRVFAPGNVLLFDSGVDSMIIKGFETLNYTDTETTVTSSLFSSNVGAILIPEYYSETWTRVSPTVTASTSVVKSGFVKRVGNTLYTKAVRDINGYEDAVITSSYTYGSVTNLTFGINAQSLGAGTVQPFVGGISSTGGTTSCTYDPSITSSCTTTQSFIATSSGGSGAGITYSWSLSGTGYSFTTATTGSTCGITNSGGGTTNYTGTLTCTMTQSGVTSSPSFSLSHLHTSNATGLTGSIAVSSQTATCTYSSGTCSTSEVHTVSTSGGDGTAKTYSWTIPTNPGNFSLSSPTTGTSVTVSKDAAAGTYTCTVQCAVTQSGTTINITQTVSHTHTFVSSYTVTNPLSCNNGTYAAYSENSGGVVSSSSTFRIFRDGTWNIQFTGGTTVSSTWISPTSSTVGDGYYVRFKRTSGSTTGGGTLNPSALNTYTSWLSLTSTQLCSTGASTSVNGTFPSFGTYTIEISADQSTVLSTTSVNLNASVYRGVIN